MFSVEEEQEISVIKFTVNNSWPRNVIFKREKNQLIKWNKCHRPTLEYLEGGLDLELSIIYILFCET